MHARTHATLEKLRQAAWFSNVGLMDDGKDVIVLHSWPEAMASCASAEWENLCLEAANEYRDRLSERSTSVLEQWNAAVGAIKPIVAALVAKKTQSVVTAHRLPKVFVDCVEWDILHLCMESEFADTYPPGFFASQAFWYVNGRFPCGWRGDFPRGKLVIF